MRKNSTRTGDVAQTHLVFMYSLGVLGTLLHILNGLSAKLHRTNLESQFRNRHQQFASGSVQQIN